MSYEIPWIRETLLAKYPQLDHDGGVDLDNSGNIEEDEIADTDHNQNVSEEESYRFYVNNRSILNRRIAFLRWGSGLSPDNPIHQLIYLESKLVPSSEIQTTYQFLTDIVEDVRQSLSSSQESEELPPLAKMARVYLVLREQNVSFDTQLNVSSYGLFTDNVRRRELDCDTATFILLTAAHEFDWPVHAITAPDHMATRWVEGNGEYIDFETTAGMPTNDYLYMNLFHISREQVEQGIFLGNLTPAELSGQFYMNRGIGYSEAGRPEEAIADFNRAIELNTDNPMAYANRAVVQQRLGHLEEALADFNRAIELHPNDHQYYLDRATVKIRLGKFAEAIEDLNRSLELSPESAEATYLRGVANVELGNLEEGNKDFERAIVLEPRLAEINYQPGDGIDRILEFYMNNSEAEALFQRAMVKVRAGDFEGALADLNRAIELDPQDEMLYSNRGAARAQLGQYEEAMADFNRALELYPRNVRVYCNIATLKMMLGDYQEALRNVERALEIDPENEQVQSLARTLRLQMELNH